jgi:hypothetical protein
MTPQAAPPRPSAITVAAGLCVVLSGIATYAIARQLPLNSDEVQSFLAAQSMLHGNVLLTGWHLSVDNFTFDDTIPLVFLEGTFGTHIAEIPVFGVIVHMLILALACIASLRRAAPARSRAISLAMIVLLLGVPPSGVYLPMLFPGLHGTGLLLSLAALLCLARLARPGGTRRRWITAGFFAAAVPAIASDPFTLIYAFFPALLVLGWSCLAVPEFAAPATRFGLVAGTICLGLAIPRAISWAGGFHMEPTLSFRFARPDQLPGNAFHLVSGFLNEAGANLVGRNLRSLGTLTSGARFAGWICGTLAVRRSILAGSPGAGITLDRLLLAGFTVLATACLTSRMFANAMGGTPMIGTQESTRYLTPLLVFGGILAARAMPSALAALPAPRLRHAAFAALLACAAGLLIGHEITANRLFRSEPWIAANPQAEISRFLLSQGLTCGVANFWDSNIVTALSDGHVTIRAVAGPPRGPLHPFLWLSDESWYAHLKRPQFALWRTGTEDWLHVTADTIRATYGEPARVEQFSGYSVAVFAAPACP